jgi:hypothetical protein
MCCAKSNNSYYCDKTPALSMLNKGSKHLSRQMVKFINLLSKGRLTDTNVVYKHNAATKIISVYSFVLQPIYTNSAENDPFHVTKFV